MQEPEARPVGSTGEGVLDEFAALKAVTQETRANLIADMVGHPEGMVSIPEFNHLNPDIERSAISEHLTKLQEVGVVAKAEIEVGERSRDLPYAFFYITDAGRDLFDRNNIFDPDVWQDTYEKVAKPPEIKQIERMDRPSRS